MSPQPEPWLRGTLPDVHPLVAPLVRSLEQVREDLYHHTAGLSPQELWLRPYGLAPVGFQLRHLARSLDRLTTYLLGQPLSSRQLEQLQTEMDPGAGWDELWEEVDAALRRTEEAARALDPASFTEPRTVGRQQLPTTVVGLVVHIAEHTQRHLGQAISAAKLARAAQDAARL